MYSRNGELVTILKKHAENIFSIRWRLVITYFIIILLTLFLISSYILKSLEEYFFTQKGIELLTRANVTANIVLKNIEQKYRTIDEVIKDLQIDREIRVIITDKEATVIFDNADAQDLKGKTFLKEEVVKALQGKDYVSKYHEDETGWRMNVAVPMIKERETIGVVYLATSVEVIEDFIKDVRRRLFAISVVVSIMIGFLSYVLALIITSPIENLTSIITNMSYGSLNQKVDVVGNDEIAQLGMAFNKMSEKLSHVEEKRKQFVSNASHELKTPLSSIKVLSESLLQAEKPDMSIVKEFLRDINTQIDRLSRIIDKLISLARMDNIESEPHMGNINCTSLIEDIIKSLLPLAKEKEITFDLKLESGIIMEGDEDKLWEAIFNIIDNSIKYTRKSGKVDIELIKNSSYIQINISDNGIGIPNYEIDKIFDRFYRVDKARARETGGTGLGLSIALSAVRLHGGDINVESKEGEGTKFKIILPIVKA